MASRTASIAALPAIERCKAIRDSPAPQPVTVYARRDQSRLAGSSSRSIDFDIADRIEQITKKMLATKT